MYLTLKKSWEVVDGSFTIYHNSPTEKQLRSRLSVTISAGTHQIERIPNPLGHDEPWLVLIGTKIGQTESSWRVWEGSDWGDSEVVIVED